MKIEEQMWEEFGEIEGRYMQVLLRDIMSHIDEKYEGLIGTEILQHHYRLREADSGH